MRKAVVSMMMLSTLLVGVSWCWAEDEEGVPEGQQFLFMLEEAYLQEQGEWQVGSSAGWLQAQTLIDDGSPEKNDLFEWLTELEFGLTEWLQLELEVPFESKDTEGTTVDGLGDLGLGVSVLLAKEDEDLWWKPTLAAGAELVLPTGEFQKGLGTDEVGYEFGLSASKQCEAWVFHLGAGVGSTNNAKESNGDLVDETEIEYGAAVVYRSCDDVELICELHGAWEREKGEDEMERVEQLYLTLGTKIEPREGWEVGIGVPLGLTHESYDWGVILKAICEWE